jgi:hypothetical protein
MNIARLKIEIFADTHVALRVVNWIIGISENKLCNMSH